MTTASWVTWLIKAIQMVKKTRSRYVMESNKCEILDLLELVVRFS